MYRIWSVIYLLVFTKSCTAEHGSNHSTPSGTGSTTDILNALRLEIVSAEIQALLVTTDDEHQNEFVGPADKRIKQISGFTGSAGTVIVTADKAVLWTDGRYHIQAEHELDNNWLLMRSGLPKVPKIEDWLASEFPNGAQLGADPKLIPAKDWQALQHTLRMKNANWDLIKTKHNLVDTVWNNKPQENEEAGFVLDVVYSGNDWQHKVKRTRQVLNGFGADAMIVTALDEIAWLLNLRGSDIPYSPVVKSYVFLSKTDVVLFLEKGKLPVNFTEVYEPKGEEHVRYVEYKNVWNDLPTYISQFNKILVPTGFSFNLGVSKAIYDMVPKEKRVLEPSPIVNLKAEKNPTEIKWMEYAHIQDAVALCEFFQYFEEHVNDMDELKASNLVDQFRFKGKSFVSLSFDTISAYGPNSALPHYIPTSETSLKISNGSLFMVDSGGQYLGGTTDITRTISIGKPTHEQKEAYTRVLMGSIELSTLIFPASLNLSQIDLLARAPLWELGYDYMHGTGHGVGSFLLVHESPINIRYSSRQGVQLEPGHFTSIEPGIYLENKFGVRLENVVRVTEKTDLKYKPTSTYLGFKTVSLFPYDMALLDFNLLSKKHVAWLKEYYKQILEEVGGELKTQKKISTYNWLSNQLDYILNHLSVSN